jgi:hypothetical protein
MQSFGTSVIDNLAAGLIVASVSAFMLWLVSPKEQVEKDIAALEPWNRRSTRRSPTRRTTGSEVAPAEGQAFHQRLPMDRQGTSSGLRPKSIRLLRNSNIKGQNGPAAVLEFAGVPRMLD